MRFKTSSSLSFLNTFFSSKRELLFRLTPLALKDLPVWLNDLPVWLNDLPVWLNDVPVWLKELVELANYLGRDPLYSEREHFLIEEMSLLNEKSTFSWLIFYYYGTFICNESL